MRDNTTTSRTTGSWQRHEQQPFGIRLTAPEAAELSELPGQFLLELLREHRLVVLSGLGTTVTIPELEDLARTLGMPRMQPDRTGDEAVVIDITPRPDPESSDDWSGFMPIHWDGMHSGAAPALQIFHCVQAIGDPADGGSTLFCDTTKLLADATPTTRAFWETLNFTYAHPFRDQLFTNTVPLVVPHPSTGAPTLRFSEPVPADANVPNPPTVHLAEAPADADEKRVINQIRSTVYDPRYMYAHRWTPGDILIYDNHALLHTREVYPAHMPRQLRCASLDLAVQAN